MLTKNLYMQKIPNKYHVFTKSMNSGEFNAVEESSGMCYPKCNTVLEYVG